MRLMIVDDDIQIREGIHYGIDWQLVGIDEVRDYADGKKALEAYDSFKPDIVLADIRMPQIDGLELLKRIRKKDENVRFILLSAYSDFEYCKEAICLGANDYELKPVKAANLKRIIGHNIKILLEERCIQESYMKIQQSNILEKILINRGTEKGIDSNIIRGILEKQYHLFDVKLVFIAVITLDGQKSERKNSNIIDRVEECLYNIIHEKGVLQRLQGQQIVYLCKLDNSLYSAFQQKTKMKGLLEKANCMLQEEGIQACAGVSDSCTLENIQKGYKQALVALSECFYIGRGSVIFYKPSIKERSQTFSKHKEFLEGLVQTVKQMDRDLMRRILLQLEHRLKEERVDILAIKKLFEQVFRESGRNLEKYFSLADMQVKCDEAKYLEQYIAALKNELEKIIAYRIKNEQKKKYSNAVAEAISYIEEYYKTQITIKKVASIVNKTPNYLSAIFKKEVGCSFTNYIIKLRMHEAKTLIINTGIPINEIASEVGYDDYIYFSKVFKKTYGYPASFLRKHENVEEVSNK